MTNAQHNHAPTPKALRSVLPPEGLYRFARVHVQVCLDQKESPLPDDGMMWVGGNLLGQLHGERASVRLLGKVEIAGDGTPVLVGKLSADVDGWHATGQIKTCEFEIASGATFMCQSRRLAVRVRFDGLAFAEFTSVSDRAFRSGRIAAELRAKGGAA